MSQMINPLNTNRTVDLTKAYTEVAYPFGAFSKTGLFTPEYVTQEVLIATVGDNDLGKMTGFTSRTERDAQRTAKSQAKSATFIIPKLKQTESITYENFQNKTVGWANMTNEARAVTITDETLDRLERMSKAMSQSMEYLAVNATKGLVLDPYDGELYVDMFNAFGQTRVTETLDLTDPQLDIFAWAIALKENIQKRNRAGGVLPVVDILVSTADMQAVQSHPSLALLRASLLATGGTGAVSAMSTLLYAKQTLTEHGISQVFDLQNGVRFITYPANFKRPDGEVVSATKDGEAHTILRGLTDLYRVAYAPAPYFSQLGTLGQEVYAWRTPIKEDQHFELYAESSPLFYMSQPDLAVSITIKK